MMILKLFYLLRKSTPPHNPIPESKLRKLNRFEQCREKLCLCKHKPRMIEGLKKIDGD